MDSQERHDLKTNDLQDFIENFGDFWSKWGNTLLTVVAVIVIIFAGSKIYGDWTSQARETAWSDLAGASSPQAADMVASDHSGNTTVRILATLKAADLYLFQASKPEPAENRAKPIDEGGDPVQIDRNKMLDQAETRYKTVLQMDAPTIVKINANLGLASVEEGRANWDKAKTYYEAASTLAAGRFETLETLAKQKLELLPQLSRKVVFGPNVDQRAEGMGATGATTTQPDGAAPSPVAPTTTDTDTGTSIDDIFGGNPVDTMETLVQPQDDDAEKPEQP